MPSFRRPLAELEAAAPNDPGAAFRLSHLVRHGLRGATRSDERGLALLTQAAEAGHAAAACELGTLYSRGRSVPANPASAIDWYRRAAAAGSADAQENLYYLLGEDARDEKYRWLVAAAEQEAPFALNMLGQIQALSTSAKKKSPSLPRMEDLATFARTPLEDLAAQAKTKSGFEVAFTFTADDETLQRFVTEFVDGLTAFYPRLEVVAEVASEPIDFPGYDPLPAGVRDDMDSVELNLRGSGLMLSLFYDPDESAWSFKLFSSGPHPDAARQAGVRDTLNRAAARAHVELLDA